VEEGKAEGETMNRRIGVLVLAILALTSVCPAAQQTKKVPRIGVLWPYSSNVGSPLAEAFRHGLRDLGYVEGQNIALEERWAEGKLDRLPSLAAELVQLEVDVIVAAATPTIPAAQ
jgi:ABC-type uncharacterized transport system substrate-binding protein